MITRTYLVIQFAEQNVVVRLAGVGALQTAEEPVGGRALGRGELRGAGQCAHSRRVSGAGIRDRVDLARTVVSEETEKLVFDQRAAYRAAELLPLVNRLRINSLRFRQRIECVPLRIPQVIEKIAVKCVRAEFC